MRTFTIATFTVTVCSVISALVVRRRLDGLDMVGVLKSRE
jgi:ABC-type antimicrobial peptide transport system permease subunit